MTNEQLKKWNRSLVSYLILWVLIIGLLIRYVSIDYGIVDTLLGITALIAATMTAYNLLLQVIKVNINHRRINRHIKTGVPPRGHA